MRLWLLPLREGQRRPGRVVLTLLGMTLALSLVVAAPLTTHAVRRAYRDLFEDGGDASVLEITSLGPSGFDSAALPDLREVAGVRRVEPRIRGAVGLAGPAGGVAVALLGKPLARDDEALLDAGLAASLRLPPGQFLRVWSPRGQARLRLAGTLPPRAASAATGGRLVVSLATARRLLALPPGRIHALRIQATEGTSLETLRRQLARRLPAGLSVETAGSGQGQACSTLLATELSLSALGVLALLAAGFVHLNTSLLALDERRRQLALLATLGARRGQVLRLLLGESLTLGAAGAVLGAVAGTGLAALLLGVMERFLGVALPGPEVRPGPYLLAGVLGPCLAVLAAFWPAWQASRRAPLDELLPRRSPDGVVLRAGPRAVGLLALVVGGALAIGLCWGWFSGAARAVLLVSLPLLLGGGVLALPLLLAPLLRLARALPLGLEGHLAARQLQRHPGRTALAAGVLFLSLAVTVGFGHALRAVLRDVRGWCRRSIVADFLVRGPMPDTSFVLVPALPDSLADELADLEGVAGVERIAFLPARGNGRPLLVLARTFAADQPLPLDLRAGEPEAVRRGLMRGEVVLGSGLAGQLRLQPGDQITLATRRGPVRLRVAGTASEFAGGGAALYLEWRKARELLDVAGPHVFLVRACPAAGPALETRLRSFCSGRELLLQSNAELRELIDGQLKQLGGALWSLMLLVFVVAALGTACTLRMNSREQADTFAILHALGLRPRQVRRLVLWQGLLLAALAMVPGALAGLGIALAISRGSASAGVIVPFRPEAGLLAASCAVTLGSAVVAALGPARLAAGLCRNGLS